MDEDGDAVGRRDVAHEVRAVDGPEDRGPLLVVGQALAAEGARLSLGELHHHRSVELFLASRTAFTVLAPVQLKAGIT